MKVNQLDAPDLVSEEQLKLAAAFLKSGNRQGYEQFRQTEIAKLSPINLASEYQTFKVGLVLPPDPNMLQQFYLAAGIVEKRFPNAKELRPNPRHATQWSEALALLEYRQGHFIEAIGWCYRHGMDLRCTQPVLVGFLTSWSKPCQLVEPVLDEVAQACNGNAKILKVNVDDNPDLGDIYGVQSIPALVYFFNGTVRTKIVGMASPKAVLAKLNSLTPGNTPAKKT